MNYVIGVRRRGRRKAVKPRYDPVLWNLYEAVLQEEDRTNNPAEGWHNRFQTKVGRSHPSFYAFVEELISEQAMTDFTFRELSLHHKVKKARCGKKQKNEKRILDIVHSYEEYATNNMRIEYLKIVAYHIHM